jgi:hypothetical protein
MHKKKSTFAEFQTTGFEKQTKRRFLFLDNGPGTCRQPTDRLTR